MRQRNRISLRNTQIGSEYHFAAAGSVAATKQNFTAQHINRQRISIRCSRFSCGSETEFHCATHKSTANINSLQQNTLISAHNITAGHINFSTTNTLISAHNITAEHINFSVKSFNKFQQNTHTCMLAHPIVRASPLSVAAAKQNFAAQHTNRQGISIRCSRFSSAAKTASLLAPQFRCTTHNSAANITSLQEV